MMRCLIATLGKDAPGTNAVIRASTRLALERGLEVFGAKRGFLGVLENSLHKMKDTEVGLILGKGGSLLGSTDFRIQAHDGETLGRIAAALKKFDLLIAAGGLGSFAILDRLYSSFDMGITTTLFVPCSVENEFLNPARGEGPEKGVHAEAVGADTATNTAIEAIDRLREQSYLSRTMFLVQCLGAKSNYLPLEIGVACGANRIYLPSYPSLSAEHKKEIQEIFGKGFDPTRLDVRELVEWIKVRFDESQKKYLLAIIPKGLPLVNLSGQSADSITLRKSGEDVSIAPEYEDIVTSMAPLELTALRLIEELNMHFADSKTIQVRSVVLDDLQYGGSPTARDRVLGSLYGSAAVEEFLSVVNRQETEKRGNLSLLAIDDTTSVQWRCFPREEVAPLYKGTDARAGGVDALPFFRQSRGTVSGYRPWATV